MKSIKFDQCNTVIGGDQKEYEALQAYNDIFAPSTPKYFCMELSDEEWSEVVATKRIWMVQHTFNKPLNPINLFSGNPFGPHNPTFVVKEDVMTYLTKTLDPKLVSSAMTWITAIRDMIFEIFKMQDPTQKQLYEEMLPIKEWIRMFTDKYCPNLAVFVDWEKSHSYVHRTHLNIAN